MQIEISDDLGNHLQNKAVQAGFDSVEAFLLHFVVEEETGRDDADDVPYDEWREKYWEFVARQRSRNPNFDDSRESIYLGP